MSYAKSQVDKDNFKWFERDKTRNSLVGIKVLNGNIRGIYPCDIEFTYPISAFVGENGSGKSTMLALAACAFHNTDGFHQFSRKKSYYTYGDFFTFSPEETGLQGIEITYTIRQSEGDVGNKRWKKPSGKWNDFNTRKNRNVVYLGINRIVPPAESSAHRSYRKAFMEEGIDENVLSKVKGMASRIFGKNYANLRVFVHGMYRLFLVERNTFNYSGFNMGAGENAVFTILLELLTAGPGALMVIDEIELGLHAKAQKEFIRVLKEICKDNKCQIICSTHSDIVLDAIPPEARYYIQSQNDQTLVTPAISAEYAFGKLAGQNSDELDVFVEDEVGKAVIMNLLPMGIRERVNIYPIGSDEAVLKQMAARYRVNKLNFIAFLDGDKRRERNQQIDHIKNHLETRIENPAHFQGAVDVRLCYIPGDTWPESYLIQRISACPDKQELVSRWEIGEHDIARFLDQALTAGKHKEFFRLAELLSIDEGSVRNDCVKFFKTSYRNEAEEVCQQIERVLQSI